MSDEKFDEALDEAQRRLGREVALAQAKSMVVAIATSYREANPNDSEPERMAEEVVAMIAGMELASHIISHQPEVIVGDVATLLTIITATAVEALGADESKSAEDVDDEVYARMRAAHGAAQDVWQAIMEPSNEPMVAARIGAAVDMMQGRRKARDDA